MSNGLLLMSLVNMATGLYVLSLLVKIRAKYFTRMFFAAITCVPPLVGLLFGEGIVSEAVVMWANILIFPAFVVRLTGLADKRTKKDIDDDGRSFSICRSSGLAHRRK